MAVNAGKATDSGTRSAAPVPAFPDAGVKPAPTISLDPLRYVHNSIDYGAVACVGGSAFTGIPADHDLHTILSVLQKAAHDQGWKLVTRSTSEKEGKAEFICQAGRKYRMYPKKLPPGEKGHRVTHSKCLGTCQARINLRRSVTQRGENKEATAWSAWRVTTAINTHRCHLKRPLHPADSSAGAAALPTAALVAAPPPVTFPAGAGPTATAASEGEQQRRYQELLALCDPLLRLGARGDGEFVYVMSAIRKLRNDVEAAVAGSKTSQPSQPAQHSQGQGNEAAGGSGGGGAARGRKRAKAGAGDAEAEADADEAGDGEAQGQGQGQRKSGRRENDT